MRSATREPGAADALLARVQTRARAAEQAEADLHAAIREGAAERRSLRRIGAAAGLSHEQIRNIVGTGRAASGAA